METFIVYDQRPQLSLGNNVYKANLVEVGKVVAHTGDQALDIAKERKMARFPVIGGKPLDRLRIDHYRSFKQRFE
jgi:hypothetical protein